MPRSRAAEGFAHTYVCGVRVSEREVKCDRELKGKEARARAKERDRAIQQVRQEISGLREGGRGQGMAQGVWQVV